MTLNKISYRSYTYSFVNSTFISVNLDRVSKLRHRVVVEINLITTNNCAIYVKSTHQQLQADVVINLNIITSYSTVKVYIGTILSLRTMLNIVGHLFFKGKLKVLNSNVCTALHDTWITTIHHQDCSTSTICLRNVSFNAIYRANCFTLLKPNVVGNCSQQLISLNLHNSQIEQNPFLDIRSRVGSAAHECLQLPLCSNFLFYCYCRMINPTIAKQLFCQKILKDTFFLPAIQEYEQEIVSRMCYNLLLQLK